MVVDSTSDDTESFDAKSQKSQETAETEDIEDLFIAEKCKPMTSLMPNLPPACRHFVFDACAGLSGSETLSQYPCIFEPQNARFFVWLGDTDLALFTKSTFMNLSNFAESAGARTVIFLIFHAHR